MRYMALVTHVMRWVDVSVYEDRSPEIPPMGVRPFTAPHLDAPSLAEALDTATYVMRCGGWLMMGPWAPCNAIGWTAPAWRDESRTWMLRG